MRCRPIWVESHLLVVMCGGLWAAVSMSWSAALACYLVGGLVVAAFWVGYAIQVPQSGTTFWTSLVRRALVLGAWGGASFLALVALMRTVPAPTLAAAALLVVTSPAVRPRLAARRPRRSTPANAPRPPAPVSPAPGLARTTPPTPIVFAEVIRSAPDQTVASMWVNSYWTLLDSTTLDARLSAVANRQTYLDEWERRHPLAFRAWLQAGPRASSSLR